MSADAQRYIEIQDLKAFSVHKPFRWLGAVLLEWTIILGLIYASVRTGWWPLWVVSGFIIGTRQHALGIMAHESVHSLVSSNRRVNDTLGNLLTSYPITYPVQGYRGAHLKHHRTLDTTEDPERVAVDLYPDEWTFPMPKQRAIWLMVRDVFGFHQMALKDLIIYIWQPPKGQLVRQIVSVIAWHAIVLTAAIMTGYGWAYLLLWIVPLYTVAVLCFRVRTVAEHSGIYEGEVRYQRTTQDTIATTRTITRSPVLQFLFAPYNMCYHIEHHLYPGVPVFALRRLHEHLMGNPAYAAKAHVTGTYGQLFGELTTPSDRLPSRTAQGAGQPVE